MARAGWVTPEEAKAEAKAHAAPGRAAAARDGRRHALGHHERRGRVQGVRQDDGAVARAAGPRGDLRAAAGGLSNGWGGLWVVAAGGVAGASRSLAPSLGRERPRTLQDFPTARAGAGSQISASHWDRTFQPFAEGSKRSAVEGLLLGCSLVCRLSDGGGLVCAGATRGPR